VFLALLPLLVSAQNFPARGFLPGASYDSSQTEDVNVQTGNVTYRVPIYNFPAGAGGQSMGVSLVYNSNIYDIVDSFGSIAQSTTGGGWMYSFKYNMMMEQNSGICAEWPGTPPEPAVRVSVVFPDGSRHLLHLKGTTTDALGAYQAGDASGFYLTLPNGTDVCPGNNPPTLSGTLVYYTDDGTYVRAEVSTSSGSWTLFFPNGTKVSGATVPGDATQITDRNGNSIFISPGVSSETMEPQTTITDSLGRTVTITSQLAVSNDPDLATFLVDTVTAPGVGGPLTWTINWARFRSTDQTYYYDTDNQGMSEKTPIVPGGTFIQSITLPSANGEVLTYQFGYNVNPGWGQLQTAVTPYGLVSTYHYIVGDTPGTDSNTADLSDFRPFPGPTTLKDDQKTLSWKDAQGVARAQTWSYDRSALASAAWGLGSSAPVTVTAPDGGKTTHTLCDVNAYQSLVECGTTLPNGDTIQRTWRRNCPFQIWDSQSGNPYVKTEFRTSGGQTAITDYSYDRNGNLLAKAEYDWVGQTGLTSIPQGLAATRTTAKTFGLLTGPPLGDSCGSDAIHNVDDAKAYWNSRPGAVLNSVTSTEVAGSLGTISRVEYTYDRSNDPTITGNVVQETRWRSVDENGNPLAYSNPLTDNNSINVQHTYDANGNLTSTTDANSVVTTYVSPFCSYTDKNGTLHQAYPASMTRAQGTALSRATSQTWDCATGLLLTSTDPNHVVTNYALYDLLGRPKLVKEAYGSATELWTSTVYSEADSSASAAIPLTVTTSRDRDTKQDGMIVEISEYDQRGTVAVHQSSGATVQTLGRLSVVADSFSYEAVSNPYTTTGDPSMGWTRTKYDTNGRAVAVDHFDGAAPPYPFGANTTVASGSKTSYSGNVATTTDEGNVVKQTTIDGLGRLHTVVEDPSGKNYSTTYTYNPSDHLLTVLQSGRSRNFTHDSLGRLTQSQQPENGMIVNGTVTLGTIQYRYDKTGNLLSKISPSGTVGSDQTSTITFAYDALNRLVRKAYPDGTAVTYCYDGDTGAYSSPARSCVGAPTGSLLIDRQTMVTSPQAMTTYGNYDELGRVGQSQQTIAGTAYPAFLYHYNLAGGLKSETYPSGRTLTMGFDSAGRVQSVTGAMSAPANPTTYASSITYAPNQAIQQITLGGIVETVSFNTRVQPSQIQAGSLTIGYDFGSANNNGDVRSSTITHSGQQAIQAFYTYDGVNRLKAAAENPAVKAAPADCSDRSSSWCEQYDYDAFGNRTITDNNNLAGLMATTPGAFNALNQIAGGSWGYDAAGNLTAAPGGTYAYDVENRLVNASTSLRTMAYAYDGDGRRVIQTVCPGGTSSVACVVGSSGSATTLYVYDATGELAAEYKNCQSSADCVDPNQPAGLVYLTSDMLGSTRQVVDAQGNPIECVDYLPFGDFLPSPTTGPRSGVACYGQSEAVTELFTGKERDPETGFDYFGARYFSGAQGRFTSPDAPLLDQDPSDPQSWNLYSYVRNNPLMFTDLTGNDCVYLNSSGTEVGSINNETTSKQCGKSGGYWVDGTVTQARFAYGSLILTGTTNGEDRTSASYALGPDPGLMALQQAGQMASPVTDPRFIAEFYGASALAGAALYGAGVTTIGAELTQLGELDAVALDTNAMIAAIENPTSAAGQAVLKVLGKNAPIVSRQAVREFLVKGSKEALRKFLVSRGGGVAASGSAALVQAMIRLGLKPGDAQVAASAIQSGVRLILFDAKGFGNKIGDLGILLKH
jgi:RHS repeat-associated protein